MDVAPWQPMTDRDAPEFACLVRECRPQLVRFLSRLVGEADAEDVVQIALSKAAQAFGAFRGEASPRSWLFRIAMNAGHDWNRARHASEPLPTDDEEASELAEDAGQERRLVREQMGRCVGHILQKLPETYRTVLALSDCDELSDRELAAVLGATVGAAKIRLHRARTRLKDLLEQECTFYRDEANVLCCDRKQPQAGDTPAEKTPAPAYRFATGTRHQVESRTESGNSPDLKEEIPMAVETLPSKQKNLIGVGAAIAAGCRPCTSSFVAGARETGACERGVRLVIEVGLRARQAAAEAMSSFADENFAHPEIDAAFRAERAQLEALTGVAAAVAGNAAALVKAHVEAARALGASDDQIRLAAHIGQTARRGAQEAADAALAEALGELSADKAPCCSTPQEQATCDCSAGEAGRVPQDKAATPCGCSAPDAGEAARTTRAQAACACGCSST